MDYQTTVKCSISLCDQEEFNKQEIIDQIEKFKSYVIEKNGTYGFQLLDNDTVISGKDSAPIFDQLISYVDENLAWHEEGCYIIDPGHYEDSGPIDLEDGEIEFEKSITITGDPAMDLSIVMYLNIQNFYASELEKLANKGIGISGEMSDIDGDYYEFEM